MIPWPMFKGCWVIPVPLFMGVGGGVQIIVDRCCVYRYPRVHLLGGERFLAQVLQGREIPGPILR